VAPFVCSRDCCISSVLFRNCASGFYDILTSVECPKSSPVDISSVAKSSSRRETMFFKLSNDPFAARNGFSKASFSFISIKMTYL
jgi:hypothetical protein